MASNTYYDYTATTTLADGDIIPVAPATPGNYLKIAWSALKQLIINLIYPVGSFYVQYPDAASNDAAIAFPSSKSPAALFGGTWQLVFSTEGIVFQTEGYDGEGRINGLMEDQVERHVHPPARTNFVIDPILGACGGTGNGVYTGGDICNLTGYQTSSSRSGTRTAHRNRLMRLYKRI